MKNKCSLILIITGTALILSALFLCIYNIIEDKNSGEKAEKILNNLKNEIVVSETDSSADDFFSRFEQNDNKKIQTKEIDGSTFIGYLTMPTIDLELPVMSEWSYDKLSSSPCRYKGSAEDKDLIIAAHNYSSHFRNIANLYSGDIFYFTTVEGKVYEYMVTNTEQINGSDINSMIDDPDESWDISLFTCTLDGRNRITVRAVLNEQQK